ncbi:RBBP9/YdeN family alpha/beta hydrolase [Stigmatella hybrida]|uniref:RBBP9/YdeN family alpha/beta hydrolase n=1 Tax=Stigmatella hybrida TaxID=394097 RepID=UPI001CDB2A01|nr:alpha/beta hydrolase [Stigmatella hybrida]
MERSLYIVHRWAGRPDTDFYPWLESKLRQPGSGFSAVHTLDMPQPVLPTPEAWVGTLARTLGPTPPASTVLLGHSVGCQTLLRYLSTLPPGEPIAGALLVAAWWEIDSPWEALQPWLTPIPNLERVRAAVRKWVVLLSDSDPYTPDYVRNQRLWEERLGAEVLLQPGGRHFNNPIEPAVLNALQSHFAASP